MNMKEVFALGTASHAVFGLGLVAELNDRCNGLAIPVIREGLPDNFWRAG